MRHNSRLRKLERQAPAPAPHPDLPSAPNIVLKEEGWTDEDVKAECDRRRSLGVSGYIIIMDM